MFRFAGGLHMVAGRVIVEAEWIPARSRPAAEGDRRAVRARRRCAGVGRVLGIRKGTRYVVRVVAGGDSLARARPD